MNKKVLTLSAVMASLLFGAHAHAADTRIGVTIYKYVWGGDQFWTEFVHLKSACSP